MNITRRLEERFVYKLTNGAIVHTTCREKYVKKHAKANHFPGIEAALCPGYRMPSGLFQICAYCQIPIWDIPNCQ